MKSKKVYNVFQQMSAIFMVLALLWLTISTPFIYSSQQLMANYGAANSQSSPDATEEDSSPLSNTTEEKNPNSNSVAEEYLHHHHEDEYLFSIISGYHKCHDAGTYIAFHGELLVPPPDAA